MITIISATNRQGSNTQKVANIYKKLLEEHQQEVQMLSLTTLPKDLLRQEMYEGNIPEILAIEDKYLIPVDKFMIVVPEYNGSIPGVVKLFIDATSIRNRDNCYAGKKACITGVAAGRAGNLRGIDHLTGMLNYLKTAVLPNTLPISGINRVMNEAGEITDEMTLKIMKSQIEKFVAF